MQNKSQDLIHKYSKLVQHLAVQNAHYLPAGMQMSDLVQAGMVGLIEAIQHYNPNKGAQFETYAYCRIRGCILDELRRESINSRTTCQKTKLIAKAIQYVEHSTGQEANNRAIANFLNLSMDEYYRFIREINISPPMTGSSYCMQVSSDEDEPLQRLEHLSCQETIENIMSKISQKERLVLSFYYNHGLNFKQIGCIVNLSEARVCQIHRNAIKKLRTFWCDTME